MKLFRDKYVHYPDMSAEAADKFSETDGVFCEEKYVTLLTSMCPGLLVVLYTNLQRYANEQCLMSLSKLYFPWKIEKRFKVKSETGKVCKDKDDDLKALQEETQFKEVNQKKRIVDKHLTRDGERSSLDDRFNHESDFEDDYYTLDEKQNDGLDPQDYYGQLDEKQTDGLDPQDYYGQLDEKQNDEAEHVDYDICGILG